jgi:hypothetical protein
LGSTRADHQTGQRLEIRRLVSTHLLFDLQLVHDGRQLRQNLVGLLVVFELGGNEIGEVAEGLGGIEDLSTLVLNFCNIYCSPLRVKHLRSS